MWRCDDRRCCVPVTVNNATTPLPPPDIDVLSQFLLDFLLYRRFARKISFTFWAELPMVLHYAFMPVLRWSKPSAGYVSNVAVRIVFH